MLTKAICQQCRTLHRERSALSAWDWIIHDDIRWDNGDVMCVATMNWERREEPPRGCPYVLEQVVNEADSRGLQAVPQQRGAENRLGRWPVVRFSLERD